MTDAESPGGRRARPVTPRGLRPADLLRVGAVGLVARPLRVVLSALGIAIGIAAVVAVVGVSASSRAEVTAALDRLGTNLLTASPGSTLFGEDAKLPVESVAMVGRIAPVRSATATGKVAASVYRNDHIPTGRTSSIAVVAVRQDLLSTLGGTVARGAWLNDATARYPAVVLGDTSARRLGIRTPASRVWLGGRWYGVAGILDPVPLAPEIDSSALIGWEAAQTYAGFDGHPTTLYTRSDPAQVEAVRSVLAATVNPPAPYEVKVSRPSDALAAERATKSALNGLLLGLGLVGLVVGGVGIANTMVISVIERRAEIGLRRSLGATRAHIRAQFLTESLLLSALGGIAGTVVGAAVTAAYATSRGWPTALPAWALVGAVLVTVPIGVIAGVYPALRASSVAPAQALSMQ
ncbi:MAG: putative transport system permease protein [Frankiaceae bacterium]|jgi:putative ABC transport system permease protein|nr:putative transport system permease protein [Frankiaceae bacterium]